MVVLRKNIDRITDIENEISGVVSQYGITQFELSVMASVKKLQIGSDKQRKIIAVIERKVFGKVREKRRIKLEGNDVIETIVEED